MNALDKHYIALLEDILEYGTKKQTRNGEVLSLFGKQIRHRMNEGFPLLTTKKLHWKSIVTELLWFLRGDTNIKYLLENDCNIWTGDAYKRYIMMPKELNEVASDSEKFNGRNFTQEEFINKIKTDDEFANRWGELGPVYGKQWRSWGSSIIDDLDDVYTREVDYDIQNGKLPQYSSNRKFVIDEIKKHSPRIDQIANLISELKTNPDSRRLMVSAWNVGELDQMVLPPCHYGFQVYTRELSVKERMEIYFKRHPDWAMIGEHSFFDKHNIPTRAISLMWNQRSVDTFLGLPFNIASYGLLLEIIAKEVNMVPDELIGNLGDVHLYSNHVEQAKEQIGRESYPLPKLNELPDYLCMKDNWECYEPSDFTLENYQSHPTIKAPLSN